MGGTAVAAGDLEFERQAARVAALETTELNPQLAEPVALMQKKLREAAALSAKASYAVRLLPTMLGAEEKRTYLVLFQNNAEVRATGGIPGAFAVMTAHRGRISLGAQGSSTDIGQGALTIFSQITDRSIAEVEQEFDGKGYAYTSLFVESTVAKWKLPPYEEGIDPKSLVVQKIPVHFNIGHLVTSHGDTRNPRGDFLIAMNKLSKGRHLSVGPSIPESSQLIGLDGGKMTMLYEAFTEPEPHFAQLVHKDVLDPIEFYPREENHSPYAVWQPSEASVTRQGGRVEGKVYAIRTFFEPYRIQVQQGDTVVLHITNAEQQRDEIHGFAVVGHDRNVIVDPGETKTVTFVADEPGVFPYYCTNFCSALHQEMQGYIEVVPRGQPLAMYNGNQGEMLWERRDPRVAMQDHAGH